MEFIQLFRYSLIILGILISLIGIFHQLIVGGIVTRLTESDERDIRLYLMTWITHGAYITLCGVLPSVLLILYPAYDPAAFTTLFIFGIATLLLSFHIAISGLKYKILPITMEFILLSIYSISLLTFYFLNK